MRYEEDRGPPRELVGGFFAKRRGDRITKWHLYTNRLWIAVTIVLCIIAPIFHFVAIHLDWYGNPPHPDLRIDVYTHSVSSIAIIAATLNVQFGKAWSRRRRYYWGIPIAIAFALGIIWEVFEEIVIRLEIVNFYNTFWNAVQDVYMDVLGGIVAGFFYDEVVR